MSDSRIVAIAGGSASGKTKLAHDLMRVAGDSVAGLLSLDSYYRPRGEQSWADVDRNNFDHPDSLDIDLLLSHLGSLTQGQSIDAPIYNFAKHDREAATYRVEPRPIIIVEGIFVLWFQKIRELSAYSLFVDAPEELRRMRRLSRDMSERGRSRESVTYQWSTNVQPMFERFCESTRSFAHEVVSGVAWDGLFIEALWGRICSKCQIIEQPSR